MAVHGSRYESMSNEDIKRDRYLKFRKLGHFSEFNIAEGQWEEQRPFSLPKVRPSCFRACASMLARSYGARRPFALDSHPGLLT